MPRFKWTIERLDFLRTGYQFMNVRDLTKSFNNHFGLDKTETSIRATLTNHKIRCGRKGNCCLKRRTRQLTREQEQYLQDIYKDISAAELTDLFNNRFSTNKTLQQIKSFVHNHGIKSGRTGQYTKGDMPWNTGTKGMTKANSGSFQKGDVPANIKPLGDERITKDGFIEIKVAERNPHTGSPTRYRHKQRYVYEQNFGPVPKDMVVALKDADKLNCEPENLMLISRAELLTLSRHGYREMPAELKPSVLALSKLQVKARAMEKEVS